MTILLPAAATAFGVLDPDEIVDGRAFNAHDLRVITQQANRLIRKRNQVLNLVWPVNATTLDDVSQYQMEGIAPGQGWGLFFPPVRAFKKPGLTTADCYLRANIPSGVEIVFRVGSRAVNHPDQNLISAMGTGAFEYYTGQITLHDSDVDQLWLYARGASRGDLIDTGTYGTPDSGALDLTSSTGDRLYDDALEIDGAAWATGAVSLAQAGAYIVFYDANSRILAETGAISMVHPARVEWAPALNSAVAEEIRRQALVGSGVTFEIRYLPTFALAQWLIVAQDRELR